MTPPGEAVGRFGDFELLERLGRDGPFAMFRARQARLDRAVMLKVPVGGPVTLEQAAVLRREAAAVHALDHPHIVRVFEAGEHGGRPYLAMAHVAGQRLNHRLKTGPLRWQLAVDLARQLAAALAHAHDRGAIHGALRPDVVWVTPDGQARLAGFGSPIQFEEIDDKWIGGFAGYLAPEQAGGRGAVGRNTDVYGLGALLYAMLTGVPPHQAATADATFRLIRGTAPVAPSRLTPDIPEDLDEICLKCLRVNAAKRYGAERPWARLTADLRRVQSGRSVRVADDLGGRFLAWARRQARPLRVAALLGVFALIPAGWDRLRHQAAWNSLADADASGEAYARAARYFERLQADQPGDAETNAGVMLARFRTGQALPAEMGPNVWHTGDDEWDAVQQLTRALAAAREGRKADAQAILRGTRVTRYLPRTDVERWLLEELEKAL